MPSVESALESPWEIPPKYAVGVVLQIICQRLTPGTGSFSSQAVFAACRFAFFTDAQRFFSAATKRALPSGDMTLFLRGGFGGSGSAKVLAFAGADTLVWDPPPSRLRSSSILASSFAFSHSRCFSAYS